MPIGKRFLATEPNGADDSARFRKALSRAMSSCHLSREQIAEALAKKTGQPVSPHFLNDCSSTSKLDRRFPAEWLISISEITGDETMLLQILFPHQRALLEVGKQTHSVYRELSRIPEPNNR
jgi:hypothetical protein